MTSYQLNEVPVGTIDSSNKTFVTAHNVYQIINATIDGVIYTGLITVLNNTVTFADAPTASVTVSYYTSPYLQTVSLAGTKPEKIVSNEEIALITGTTATDQRLNFWQDIAIRMLLNEFGLKNFVRHQVLAEKYKMVDSQYIRTRSFPADYTELKLYNSVDRVVEITGYAFQPDEYDQKKLWVLTSDGLAGALPYNEVYLEYVGGFVAKCEMTLFSNALTGETLTISGEGDETVYTFIDTGTPTATQILVGEDEEDTANAIATKLSGTVTQDENDNWVVILPLGFSAELSDEDLMQIVNPDVPDDLKACVAYMVAGGITETVDSGDIASYTIGGKTVNFRSDSDRNFVQSTVEKYGGIFNEPLILT